MCNEYQQRVKRGLYDDAFSQINVPLTWTDPEPNRHPDRPLKPTNRAPMIRALDPANPAAGLEGVERRWWMVPFFHKGPLSGWKAMCTNARLETVDTTAAFRDAYKRRRALIPVSSFIEYDEPPGWKKGQPKQRWEVTWDAADSVDGVRFFAGLWGLGDPGRPRGAPGELRLRHGGSSGRRRAVHDRQPALLTLEQGM